MVHACVLSNSYHGTILVTRVHQNHHPRPLVSNIGTQTLFLIPVQLHKKLRADYDFSSGFDRFSRVLHIRQWVCRFQQGIGVWDLHQNMFTVCNKIPTGYARFSHGMAMASEKYG